MAYLLISLANKTLFGQMSKYSSIYNIWGEIRPITFGNTAWPLDGTCINNDGLICHCWVPFADVTSYLPKLFLIRQCWPLFANIVPHLPMLCLICQRVSSFSDTKPDLPISIISIANTTSRFAKSTLKNIFNTPKWLPYSKNSICKAL